MGTTPVQARSAATEARSAASQILCVRGLSVRYAAAGKAPHPALLNIDCDIGRGEIVGILGESGSGKSTFARSMLGLLPAGTETSGAISFGGNDLLRINERQWEAIRGARIAMVFQDPGLSLSPVMRAGDQIGEVLRAHGRDDRQQRRQQIHTLLEDVGFSQPERIYAAYPHQLSGGELQRIAIAQALACRPELIIADEPTCSLDVTLQAEILGVLRTAVRKLGCALILITHNPALLADFADRLLVMYAGRIVEEGPVSRVYRRPLHPYTKGLLDLIPSSLTAARATPHLPAIPGSLGDSDHHSGGCVFAPRCFARTEICQRETPTDAVPEPHRRVSCFNYGN